MRRTRFRPTACIIGALAMAAAPIALGERPDGWTTWSARPETAPRTFVDATHFREKPGSLAISGNSNAAAHGGWQRLVSSIEPKSWYRFTAYYQTEGVPNESWQVVARLDWQNAKAERAGPPDYVSESRREGAWTCVTLAAQAPAESSAVLIQLFLSNAPQGTVWWSDITLEQIPAPAARKVAIASLNLRPKLGRSAADNVELFVSTVDRAVPDKVDLILLPEGITVAGTGKQYADVAETIPGDTTRRLGELARRRHSYIVAGIYEREGVAIYNTAVLIGRDGNVAGKYRKVYVPREDRTRVDARQRFPGLPNRFRRGICYDVMFADPARALASRGANVILMPIWGGDETLAKARAIENQVFLVASGYDHPTYIMDPAGEILSAAKRDGRAAIATIDLAKRYVDPWLGDMHSRMMKELRIDIPRPAPGFRQ